MNVDWKDFLNKAKVPAGIVVLVALLGLEIYNTVNTSKSGDMGKSVKNIEAGVDTLKAERRADADTVKAYVVATHTVAQRTEKKVDNVQKTADEILEKVDSCCDCNKQKPASRPMAPRDTVASKPVPRPASRDTVVVVVHDTVCPDQQSRKQKKPVTTVWCYKVINER